jgi:hypothetical protein
MVAAVRRHRQMGEVERRRLQTAAEVERRRLQTAAEVASHPTTAVANLPVDITTDTTIQSQIMILRTTSTISMAGGMSVSIRITTDMTRGTTIRAALTGNRAGAIIAGSA